jgi:(E)-4-hydroxy-3-methylbut-2-enyl-diphosphate synthase
MMIDRRKTRTVKVGKVKIGGSNPISVQSMCNTKLSDTKGTLAQIHALEDAGCEIIRVAVPTVGDVKYLKEIKDNIKIPLVADIHFDHRIALECAQYVDKLRINPGNIGGMDNVKAVVEKAKEYSLPIRIGVNGGSLRKDLITKYGNTPRAMVEGALEHIKLLEDNDFQDIMISLKASEVNKTVEAHELLAEKVDYPFHIGITESGTLKGGTIKSSVGLGILLAKGLGDTLRVSLTADPVEEIGVGFEILKSLGLRRFGREFVSCPTCGRTEIDLVSLAKKVEEATAKVTKPIKIAVMGCVVNGPGEAADADIAVVGSVGAGFLYQKGKLLRKVPEDELIDALLEEIEKI